MDVYAGDPLAGHMLWILPSLCQSVFALKVCHYLCALPVLVEDAIFITWLASVRICAKIRAHPVANIRTQSVTMIATPSTVIRLRKLSSGGL